MIDAATVELRRWGKPVVEAVQGKSEALGFACAVSRNPDRLRDHVAEHRLELAGTFEAMLDIGAWQCTFSRSISGRTNTSSSDAITREMNAEPGS